MNELIGVRKTYFIQKDLKLVFSLSVELTKLIHYVDSKAWFTPGLYNIHQ